VSDDLERPSMATISVVVDRSWGIGHTMVAWPGVSRWDHISHCMGLRTGNTSGTVVAFTGGAIGVGGKMVWGMSGN